MNTLPDRIAAGWADAVSWLAEVTPQGRRAARGPAGAVITRTPVTSLNAAYDMSREPDLAALDEMAAVVARYEVPWSIIVRGEAADAVAGLAARHGLTARSPMPVMACAATDAVLDGASDPAIRVAGADQSHLYTRVLNAGFGADFGGLMQGGVLEAPGFTGYLAYRRGRAVGTGLGVLSGETAGVFNIGVLPAERGRGLGRALAARTLADGFAAGATTAYLHPSHDGWALYESMGFRVVDTWAAFAGE
ncbi:GNAT superfamily N-acetyltransferase [Actinoplanes lutulentus]|uniref:Acetyltransferase (GNAT) family protein n=1 Tax=Actinoplanes lutulentus TaxID=1287878 RepID=A0A327YZF8_9ACTN|nr:GNAT family N-acetyltransferase [Actinoplanes lutulentus]MBB2946600.1 GNAT superfamily N-acetyltransferase [Actinoplanes lutulentus]RAK26518.1 acetyltransferase (GNAT) family protein [Actinoplanes lutulentus]